MNITIGGLVLIMKFKDLEGSYAVAAIMAVLALISAVLLVWFIKRMQKS